MSKRDEFSCPCCGTPTDSSYCLGCQIFECGERDVGTADDCLIPETVALVERAPHAAHYGNGNGHDLLIVEISVGRGKETPFNGRGEPDVRPAALPADFRYHSGSRRDGFQRWRFIKTAPLSPGKCGGCR